MAEAFKLASPHYRRPSTFQEKLGKPSSTLPLCERSLMEKAFKEDSHSHSFSFARSPNTPLTPNFQPRHPTNFVSISRKFQGGNSHDNNITGSFLIDPRIRIPAGVLRAFDSDHSLRRRGSRPNALVGSKSTKSDDEKPNLFLSTKNGTIDVDVELVSSPVPLVSESSSKSITVLELNEERSLRPLGHCSAAHGENAGIAVRIGAPHPRPAFHLCINLRIELDSIESPLPSTPSQVSSKSGKKLLQRHRPRQEAEELVSSNNFPAITEDITIQTSSRVAQTEKQSSPIRVLLPQTYHGPVTVTSTTDFTSSSHALHPSATVCLSNSLKETTVLMSETTKTHGNGGQKRKMGYFIHSYSFNEDEDPSPQISQAASSPDHSEDGDDEQWIFVTPSVPTHRGRNAHMPQLQVIGETRSQHKGNPYCEWFGDRVDIRVEFTRPPSANGEAGLSLQNDAVHVIQPEVWLGYSDEEEQFTDQLRHLVDKCATTSCVETQDRHGRVNVEDSRKGVNFLRWLTLGCVS
ncbi:hypothetical protein CPB83DRAFT_859951 [Crepidotus variabilis]|uniref:DUF7330 domain-containing protein n=1 Tax=Crepidotus variabilis TaxID=179855 RepID=A0A9P6JLE0_9AGAR|nr:hypothetical protein CPB83DRAFT_859951 [Crepidotus variabilis]